MFIVKNFREINKEAVKEMAASVKDTNQMTFGDFIENNLKIALNENAEDNNVFVTNMSEIYDYIFGADFKITFNNPNDTLVDGMSQYCDITLNKNKPGVRWLKKTRYGFGNVKYNDDPETMCILSNGMNVQIGYKLINGGKFIYQKPILVIRFCSNEPMLNCIFSKDDIRIVINILRKASYTLAYHYVYDWCGEEKKGAGKRASDNICVSSGFDEVAFSIAD